MVFVSIFWFLLYFNAGCLVWCRSYLYFYEQANKIISFKLFLCKNSGGNGAKVYETLFMSICQFKSALKCKKFQFQQIFQKKLHPSEEIVQKVIGIYMDRTKYKKIRKNTFLKIISALFFQFFMGVDNICCYMYMYIDVLMYN